MFTKLFGIFPSGGDPEVRMSGYIEETADIPPLVISHALKKLVREARTFAPSVGEIRREAGKLLREVKLRAEGRDPNEHNAWLEGPPPELDHERWIERAPEVLPLLTAPPPRLQLSERVATPEERAAGAAALERASKMLGSRMRAPQEA
jgi:hypothetical protein